MTFTANDKREMWPRDYVYPILASLHVFSFSIKSSCFAFASNSRISLHYSHICTLYFKKT